MPQLVAGLFEGRMVGEFMDVDSPIREQALHPVDVADARLSGSNVLQATLGDRWRRARHGSPSPLPLISYRNSGRRNPNRPLYSIPRTLFQPPADVLPRPARDLQEPKCAPFAHLSFVICPLSF